MERNYKYKSANSKTDGRLICNPILVVNPSVEFYGIDSYNELDYIMYKLFGWDWAETPENSIELVFNPTGESITITAADVSKLAGLKSLEDLQTAPFDTFVRWTNSYRELSQK